MAEDDRSAVANTADSLSTSGLNTEQPSAESSRRERKEEDDEVENEKQSSPEGEDEGQGEDDFEDEEGEEKEEGESKSAAAEDAPPLPDEEVPPLPDEAPLGQDTEGDDGWEPVWDANAQAFYFYNRMTGVSQWENPRVPDAAATATPATAATAPTTSQTEVESVARGGGYNPAIHGDYDPTAAYAQQTEPDAQLAHGATAEQLQSYAATGAFNRFTGRWQDSTLTPENFNDENKSRRQMNAFFDVDAAANSHDGRSLKAERSGKKLSKAEVKAFREKRRERKEEKRRAWLRD